MRINDFDSKLDIPKEDDTIKLYEQDELLQNVLKLGDIEKEYSKFSDRIITDFDRALDDYKGSQLESFLKYSNDFEGSVSTDYDYIAAEEWIENVLSSLNSEYSIIQKIAIIDNAIGKKISYSPDFETEVFDEDDIEEDDNIAIYKIINSGYGVCNGISKLEAYMLRKIGVDFDFVASKTPHSFLKLKNVEFELEDGEIVKGTTILDPTWNLAAHRFNARPKNFCISYEEARKSDIDSEGNDHKCHENDYELEDATFNLDEKNLRNLFKSVHLTDKEGNFLIKYLIENSEKLYEIYANQPLKIIEEQFLLLAKVCPEFATCQNSTMMILKEMLHENEFFTYDRCVVNRCYNKLDNNRKPVIFVYIKFDELGEKFYYADKEKAVFKYISKNEFLEQFDCYEADLQKNNGIRPWEEFEKEETKTDLVITSETSITNKEGEGR